MKISERINQLDFSTDLPRVMNLLSQQKSQGDITFWGKRVIVVRGYDGCIALDEVARKVIDGAATRCLKDDLKPSERLVGLGITARLKEFYTATDTKILQANWFTRLLNSIREFTFTSDTPRLNIEKGSTDRLFKAYSIDKFIRELGDEKNDSGYINAEEVLPPNKIVARKDAIEKLVNKT